MPNHNELRAIAGVLDKANRVPEKVFGELSGNPVEAVKDRFRDLAHRCHPDHFAMDLASKELADATFKLLTELRDLALNKINNGQYGKANTVLIKTKITEYTVDLDSSANGDLATVYKATDSGGQCAIKVADTINHNGFLLNERKILGQLWSDKEAVFLFYLPRLMDSFQTEDRREANVFDWLDEYYTLADVKKAFPTGLEPRTIGWMFRRLLAVLGYAHKHGIIHGGVIPTNIMVKPDAPGEQSHSLVLIDWTCAVAVKDRIRVISNTYEDLYPPEILNKEQPGPDTDIWMAAKMMHSLCQPNTTLQRFFAGCCIGNRQYRPQSAWDLHLEFTDLLERMFGPKRFHPFVMP